MLMFIIQIAIKESGRKTRIIASEDGDVLIILIARSYTDKFIYLLKPEKVKIETKKYFVKLEFISLLYRSSLIFGCNDRLRQFFTTIFKTGKINELKLFRKIRNYKLLRTETQ